MLRIPRAPRALQLAIDRRWNGAAGADARRDAWLSLAWDDGGLSVAGGMRHARRPRLPGAAPGQRVADLWEYDVVECFLVGQGGRYLEVELGAGGHFLVLSFAGPRQLADAHRALAPALSIDRGAERWRVALALPWDLVPGEICALNAFAVADGVQLAHHPVPGAIPDFHQPQRFPAARLERA